MRRTHGVWAGTREAGSCIQLRRARRHSYDVACMATGQYSVREVQVALRRTSPTTSGFVRLMCHWVSLTASCMFQGSARVFHRMYDMYNIFWESSSTKQRLWHA